MQGTQSLCSVTTWKDGVRREVEHMYSYGQFMMMYGRNCHNIVKELSYNSNK